MSTKDLHRPIFQEFINDIRKGYLLLDDTRKAEVKSFIESQQETSGAFVNRGGKPDLYYSLFGAWLSKALNLDDLQNRLQKYSEKYTSSGNNLIDKYSLLLIKYVLDTRNFSNPTLFSFLKTFVFEGRNLNHAYRIFLFLLTFDAFFRRNKFVSFILKIILLSYRVPEDIPCSFRSAWLLARHSVGIDVERDTEQLLEYYEPGGGFKAFKETESPDLLSTAVALFALKRAGADLRMIAPDALELVQQNYDSGAFLAGNGDEQKDLEYTFYGLLILGTLSEDEAK